MSNDRPEPAPTTWMMAAHSAFFSMSAIEDFWTFRILPRIGSSAWNSELRAALAEPIAESPSMMNISERSTSSERQSASLAGSAEVSSAFLRRCASLCWRAVMRVGPALAIFSSTPRAIGLSLRLAEVRKSLNEFSTTRATIRVGGRGAQDLLGLALELRLGQPDGDHRGQALEDVVADHVVVVDLQQLGRPQLLVGRLEQRRLPKPARWVPPLGVAMMFTNERITVSYSVPQRSATSTNSSRSMSAGVMCPCSSSTGTVSVNLPEPVKRSVSVIGRSGARNSTNSEMPPA